MGDWGWGIGDWGLGPIPNPQSPIPNPQSPIPIIYIINSQKKYSNSLIKNIKIKKIIILKFYFYCPGLALKETVSLSSNL